MASDNVFFLCCPVCNCTVCFSLSLSFFLSVCLLSHFLLFAMLAGPNLPADISIPWHSANWQHCRRERKREGENERKLVNNRRREGAREWEGDGRSMNQGKKERQKGKEDRERKNNNGGLRKDSVWVCVCLWLCVSVCLCDWYGVISLWVIAELKCQLATWESLCHPGSVTCMHTCTHTQIQQII